MKRTWDGLQVAGERPFAVCVVVWRDGYDGREFLVLHRLAPGGPGFGGDWAWTPPAGARQPGEEPEAAALRELLEETGLALDVRPLAAGAASGDVALYTARAGAAAAVVLDVEHDRFAWLPLEEALARCRPATVADGLARAAASLPGRATGRSV